MKLVFDARILTHQTYTGVENYARSILDHIGNKIDIRVAKPTSSNKYLAHLWTHFILPFIKGDILFCPANIAPLFVPWSKKLVVTLHDVAFITYPESFSRFFRTYYKLIIPFVIKRADRIITVSYYSKSEIEKYYPAAKGKIEVVHLGKNRLFRHKNDIGKQNIILYVGSMNERKNFTGVIKAFELLNSTDHRLVMVGRFNPHFAIDEESREILDRARQNPSIEFRSDVSDEELVRIYNSAKLFVLPSFYEGFGLPLLEAFVCGTPVVCSSAASLPEVGGDAALYCDPYDIEDIKEKIKSLLDDSDLRRQMIQRGFSRADEFDWEKSAAEHIRIFQEAVGH